MTTRHDLILATIRTAIPAGVGWVIAWAIAQIPAVADIIAVIDGFLATSAPGYTVAVILTAILIALTTAVYYWVVRELGKRWPSVEAWLLGSAKQPTYVTAGADTQEV